jgi:hypothetical protein
MILPVCRSATLTPPTIIRVSSLTSLRDEDITALTRL